MIYNQVIEDDDIAGAQDLKTMKNKNFIYRILTIVLISALLSPVYLTKNIAPMPYIMLAVASVYNVPLLLMSLISVLTMAICKMPADIIVTYVITFAIYTAITSILNVNGVSKKYSVLIKIIMSMLIVNIVQVLFLSHSFKDMILYLFSVSSIYLVFTHGISVVINIRKGYVFTEEEKISAMCILAFLLTTICEFNIFRVSISNIIAIMVVLIYGYKSGSIQGCVAGFIIGLIMCIVNQSSSLVFLVILATGGFIAGLMNKIGKVAMISGFIIGTAIISYFVSNFAYYAPNVIEIVIAAIPVLIAPKSVVRKIDEFFNFNNTLNVPYTNLLNSSKSAEQKLNAISDLLADVSAGDISYTKEDKVELRDILNKYVLDYMETTNLGVLPVNKIIDIDKIKISIDYISTKLESGDEITEDMLMFESPDKKQIITNIKDIYNSIKIMRILKKKEEEVYKKCNDEYKEISSIISIAASDSSKKVPIESIKGAKNIREELKLLGYVVYEDELIINNDYSEYTFITDILEDIDMQKKEIIKTVSDILGKNMTLRLLLNISKTEKSKIKLASVTEYIVHTNVSQINKDGNTLNGDSHLCMNFGKNKYISVISDGAGSGEIANSSSSVVINSLEKLIKAGFDESKASEIVNKVIKLRQSESNFASLDVTIFNLETGDSSFMKFGAAPTYILTDGKVTTINSMNIPVGLVNDAEYIPIVKKLNNMDIVVQISDGVISGINNVHDNYFTNMLSKINNNLSTKEIADKLTKCVKENLKGINDDVTIAVSKVMASKSIK